MPKKYDLLERFAGGDPEILDDILQGKPVFFSIMHLSVQHMKEYPESKIRMKDDPEGYLYRDGLGVLMAAGIGKLFDHIVSQKPYWGALRSVLKRLELLSERLGGDASSLIKDFLADVDKGLDFDEGLYEDSEGMPEMYPFVCQKYFLKKIYDAHLDSFELIEPPVRVLESEIEALRKEGCPADVIPDIARNHTILLECCDDFIQKKALEETGPQGPGDYGLS